MCQEELAGLPVSLLGSSRKKDVTYWAEKTAALVLVKMNTPLPTPSSELQRSLSMSSHLYRLSVSLRGFAGVCVNTSSPSDTPALHRKR